ncbi:MAG TPA: ABC transporter permease [Bacteroidales bacterium]|jgi:ABC-2 type transport system permease protein|nr:ABC transporter permease [Bacteroidales bacterium]
MNKIGLIISREYLTRVKKKTFIIMTILAPLLLAALIVVPVLISSETQKSMKVMVVDDNEFFINRFSDNTKTTFAYRTGDIEVIKKEALDNGYDAVLHILKGTQAIQSNLYYKDEPSMTFNSNIESQMDKLLFDKLLIDTFKIDPVKYDQLKSLTRSSIANIKIDETGQEKETQAEIARVVGMFSGLAIYFFIFMFASQVLRGVLEEKTNRIVEVLISSVKPMELMMGKIIGIALVGLTQFLIWVGLTFVIIYGVQIAVPDIFQSQAVMQQMAGPEASMVSQTQITNINAAEMPSVSVFTLIDHYFNVSFTVLLLSFLFYFIFGYLIYAALFAAVGSAVDNETDSQQFTLPVTIPLLLTIMLLVPITENPNGPLAFWMSMIPLTSPVAMLIRLPSGVPLVELLSSMAICVLFFVFCVWFAAKIYRVGILMYGKKVTYRELFKWLRY